MEQVKEKGSDLLNKLLVNTKEEKHKYVDAVEKNLSAIKEQEEYLRFLHDSEENDFKYFSPHNVDSVYKNRIEETKQIITKTENDNQNLYRNINKLDREIAEFEKIIGENSNSEQTEIANDKIVKVQEQERQRIARDLHDSSVQNLTHLVHKVELCSKYIDQDPIRAKLELVTVSKGIREVIEEMRHTIFDLRPMSFDDIGFEDALSNLKFNLQKETDIELIFEIRGNFNEDNELILISLFRVIQECCSNSIKHSKAKQIKVIVKKTDNEYVVMVSDNGIGFKKDEMKKNHFGLSIVEERVALINGSFSIDSKANEGTIITIKIPCKKEGI